MLKPTSMRGIKQQQHGVMLLEALIGILIFSIGILALIALQSASVSATSDARYRVEAVNLANQMLGTIWTSVDRSTPGSLQADLLAFKHMAGVPSETCDFAGGAASANAKVLAWQDSVAATLPNSDAGARQQIDVNLGAGNQVTLTICWKAPSEAASADYHRHIVVTNVH